MKIYLLKFGKSSSSIRSIQVQTRFRDLADLRNDGKLTQDSFAVAMHLINGKLAGKPLPDRLPDSLIPPSLRQQQPSPAARQGPAVSQYQKDLFELDNSPPGSPMVPESAAGGVFGPQRKTSVQNIGIATPPPAFPAFSSVLPGSSVVSPPRSTQQSPFAPTSKCL